MEANHCRSSGRRRRSARAPGGSAANRRLRRANDDLVETQRLKGEFVANVNHEMRTPMNGILGLADIGKRKVGKVPDEALSDYFDRILDSGKRLIMSGLKVSDVAQLVGFQDPYYFSRMFKKVTGSSPKSFKESESTE